MGNMPAMDVCAKALGPKRVLVLYDHHWNHVKTIAHYLESFHRFSRHRVSYLTALAPCPVDLDYFDAVVLHYSVRFCFAGHVSTAFRSALRRYRGLKAIFLQDEYENTHRTWQAIRDFDFRVVFTCVPEESIPLVYPPEEFPDVRFVNVLTGYVPLDVLSIPQGPALAERSTRIGYRGRNIGYWYGDLGQEKMVIGQRMKEHCDLRGIATDIGWEEADRIYGEDWFHFLGSCRATLGTESGSNVFDFDGALTARIQKAVRARPNITYEEIRKEYLEEHEGAIRMNQISPKIFEAIACKTALVLFEGRYSGVLQPYRHFLPLKKDFSNVDEVLARLEDIPFLEDLTERAFDEVVMSARWSYSTLVRGFDQALDGVWPEELDRPALPWTPLPLPPCDASPEFRRTYARCWRPSLLKRLWNWVPTGWRDSWRERLKGIWANAPGTLQRVFNPILNSLKARLKGGS